jgi:hypothetical protein
MHESHLLSGDDLLNAASLIAAATLIATDPLPITSDKPVAQDPHARAVQVAILARQILDAWEKGG